MTLQQSQTVFRCGARYKKSIQLVHKSRAEQNNITDSEPIGNNNIKTFLFYIFENNSF